jgi:pimeloyl-ACP methyl ester carboxylesterase
MTGAFNRYRANDLDATGDADLIGATVDQPSCFVGGDRDPVREMLPGTDLYADPGAACTDFRGATIVPGAGHWVHQEAPAETNAALDAFLATL